VLSLVELMTIEDGRLSLASGHERLLANCLGIQTDDAAVYRFARDDDFWWVAFNGKPRPVKDSSGMPYIAHLLARPNTSLTAMQLEALSSGIHEVAKSGSLGERIDKESLRDAHNRLLQIANELETAAADQNTVAVRELEAERDDIRAYIRKATGLGGEIRDDSDARRSADSVTKAIRRAIKEIRKKVPEFADHLKTHLQIGIDLRYVLPDPIDWDF
jgi:hypothetical protein